MERDDPLPCEGGSRLGTLLSRESRLWILSALFHLTLAGAGLLIEGSLIGGGATHPALLHLFTLGFLLFFIYALGGHMFPRFIGAPYPGGRPARLQMGLAHIGLWGFVSGSLGEVRGVMLFGALCAWGGLAIFAWRIWRVLRLRA